jgi:putative oxidoreductase
MAAITELIGGILLMLGFLFRPAVFLLFFTMLVATLVQIGDTGGIGTAASHPLKMAILFVALFLIGPGKYSVDGR